MKDLNESQVASVNGGFLPLLGLLVLVAGNASNIEDAVNGFFQNLE